MENQTHFSSFKEMSEHADALKDDFDHDATGASATLSPDGVGTDRMAAIGRQAASEFQQLIEEEIRARPMRAVGWATAAGLVLGFLVAR